MCPGAAVKVAKPPTAADLDKELESYYGNDPNRKKSALDADLDSYWASGDKGASA